jgi:glycosyltransferase involved in cell wall biosynthesis
MCKIIYFSRDFSPHDFRFLSSLAGTSNEVYWLRLENCGQILEKRSLPENINQISWRGGQRGTNLVDRATLIADLKRLIREIQPDLIHAGPVQSAALLAASAGFRPLVTMSWGSDLLRDVEVNSWMRWAAKYTLARTTVLFGDCQAVINKAVSLGFPSERCVLFPWGVDLRQFNPGKAVDFRERHGWRDAFVVLSVRSWEPLYGVDVLVRGFALAAEKLPALRLLMLGSGSQAAQLNAIFKDNGVLDRVVFAGQVGQEDLPLYFQASDLYVSASHSDGSSVSLMEALACGLPALVSDIPGNREWVTPGQEGWIFPDGDDRALADAILQAFEERGQLAEIGAAARKLAEQRADWPRNFQKLLEGYQMAIEMHQPMNNKVIK